ncbi:N-acetylmuramoyl-L-alanine amidase [candidate division KSB1 bacterium]
MTQQLFQTDKPVPSTSKYRKIKRKLYSTAAFTCTVVLITATAFYIFHTTPQQNVISRIEYSQNRVRILFRPETVENGLNYQFFEQNNNQYSLEIDDCNSSSDYTIKYDFGSLYELDREKAGSGTTRFTFNFDSLGHTPDISYVEDPPQLHIDFSHFLKDKFIVVIDPGHGGHLPGAVGQNGTKEKEVTLDIAANLQRILNEDGGFAAYLTREEDAHVSIPDRVRYSRFWKPDFFISIHANSARNRNVNQVEAYYADNSNRETAMTIRDILAEELNLKRGTLRRRRFAVIRNNRASNGSILVETMYLSNTKGEALLSNVEYRKRIAQSLYNSILHIKKLANQEIN